jgi:hypothetical protein
LHIEIGTQLALFLDNRPGALARVCEAFSEAEINIHAFSTNDTVDHIVVRMVVSDPRAALLLFEERGTLVIETEVLIVSGRNRPGELAALARKLARGGINIEYAYCATPPNARNGLLVLRTSNVRKSLKVLKST